MTWQNSAITITTLPAHVGRHGDHAHAEGERPGGPRRSASCSRARRWSWPIAIAIGFDYGAPGLQYVLNVSWIPVIGARYHVGIDGISLPLFC